MNTLNTNLHDYLQKILLEYQDQKSLPFKDNEFSKFIRESADATIPDYLFSRDEYKIHSSCGQGNWAEIPWLAVFYKDLSISAQKGYYIVYLFRADGSGVYVSLNQGYTNFTKLFKPKEAKKKIEKVSKYWHAHLNFLSNKNNPGFTVDPIDLRAKSKGRLPEGYELGNICSKFYSTDQISNITNDKLLKDLEYLKMMFTELRGLISSSTFDDFNNSILENVPLEDLEVKIIKKGIRLNKLGNQVSIPTGLSFSTTKSDSKVVQKDYIKELARNTKQGLEAEKLVLNLEIERAKNDVRLKDYVSDIVHVALDEGDGLGYDIKSVYFDEESKEVKPLHIEVKSTIGRINTPFYLSANEKRVAKEKGKDYAIYRLFRNDNGDWDYYIITDPHEILDYEPIQYKVIPKVL